MAKISRKDRTINRQVLAEAVARAGGLPRAEANDLVSQVFAIMTEALLANEPVLLSGFGKFHVVARAPRRARNVRAGLEVEVGARKALVFKPAVGLVQQLSMAQPATDWGRASSARAEQV